ncbi:MAG TPA: precorrin-6A reductase [Desulfitobacteriaceae bacterium]|nr:precorrin-6A reductase [Desulfitobacteriaceae bacterium]
MKYLVLAGTYDGRLLAEELKARGHKVVVSTLTEYGADLAQEAGIKARSGALDKESFLQLLEAQAFSAVIDATHPYATQIRKLSQSVCRQIKLPYFRWQRSSLQTFTHPLIHWTKDLNSAARKAAELGRRIFLTTGSNSLNHWLETPEFAGKRIFVRVLPTSAILQRCERSGLKPSQIIAAQGPFSQAWNEAVIRQLKIEVVITKDSGKVGGTLEKIRACLNLQVPIVILQRPEETTSMTLTKFIEHMEEQLCTPN